MFLRLYCLGALGSTAVLTACLSEQNHALFPSLGAALACQEDYGAFAPRQVCKVP